MEFKTCTECKADKETTFFSKNGKFLRSQCKECRAKIQKEKNKDPVNAQKHRESSNSYYHLNKNTLNVKKKEYRDSNKEILKEKKKEYYEKNKETILEKCKTDSYKQKRNLTLQKRRKTDTMFAMITSYRVRICEVMRSKNILKIDTHSHFLNCTKKNFFDWIEFQFDDKMNWDNYSDYWVLDHVIPINWFDLTKEEHKEKCFNWFNLRPLEKKENMIKSDKLDLIVIKKHQQQINNYKYQDSIEILDWLRSELRNGKNLHGLGNPQPSS